MSLVHLDDRVRGLFPGSKKITTTFGGMTFTAGRRTAAHLQATQDALTKAHPGCTLHVMQSCYHSGYAPSAGTHDGDGVLDVRIDGDMGEPTTEAHWLAAQGFLRAQGWIAWWRHTGSWAAKSEWHIHMVSDGCPGPVGYLIPSQVSDYRSHRDGLAGHADDDTWHPASRVLFNYPRWKKAQRAVTARKARQDGGAK